MRATTRQNRRRSPSIASDDLSWEDKRRRIRLRNRSVEGSCASTPALPDDHLEAERRCAVAIREGVESRAWHMLPHRPTAAARLVFGVRLPARGAPHGKHGWGKPLVTFAENLGRGAVGAGADDPERQRIVQPWGCRKTGAQRGRPPRARQSRWVSRRAPAVRSLTA